MNAAINFLSNSVVLWVWCILVALSLGYLFYDFTKNNPNIMPLMKWVWGLTVLYSGPIGLAVYFYSGRKQIRRDSIWRKGFRSVSHCYSGCGLGEVVGMMIATAILAWGNLGSSILTFIFAYIAGFSLTVGPLMQEGVVFKTAFMDAFYSETPSITMMEIAAIGADTWLAGSANVHHVLFWTSMVISMSVGLLIAYPVNVLLIKWGIKESMMNPKEMN